MNHYAIQQNAFSAAREEIWSSVSERRDPVVCPKPRRLGLLATTAVDQPPLRSLRWHLCHQSEVSDSKAGNDLLEIILTKGGYDMELCCTQVASSPPIFCGSPPSRVANPLIQDARFGDEKLSSLSPHMPIPPPSGLSSSPTSSSRKGGCVRANFGSKPAVRIEGFDCLDRDRHNCGIPAWA